MRWEHKAVFCHFCFRSVFADFKTSKAFSAMFWSEKCVSLILPISRYIVKQPFIFYTLSGKIINFFFSLWESVFYCLFFLMSHVCLVGLWHVWNVFLYRTENLRYTSYQCPMFLILSFFEDAFWRHCSHQQPLLRVENICLRCVLNLKNNIKAASSFICQTKLHAGSIYPTGKTWNFKSQLFYIKLIN